MRYRTIRDAATYFRQQDPETAITENHIRYLVVSGTVPSMRVGKKYLVSLEALEEYLQNPPAPEPSIALTGNKVWQIR